MKAICIFNRSIFSFRGTRKSDLWPCQQLYFHYAMSTRAETVFKKQNDDYSEEEISEEKLYKYSRYRWLSNETENLTMRYRKFNVSALIDAAVDAAGNGARSCLKMLKCIEGQYNKCFVMTMDNGREVLARIPNPNAEPTFYTTASEVATRHFLRIVLRLPVARIYSYSLDTHNPVGAEYIIEEKAEGKPLGSLWYQWPKESRLNLVAQVVDFETRMTSISFPRHGCIYYKKDLQKKGVPAYALEPRSLAFNGLTTELDPSLTEEFAFGPLTQARLWEGERAAMNLDRGPWTTPSSYMSAMGMNEIEWARTYAKPRINPYRSIDTPQHPNEFISLLERYLQVVPYLSPGSFRKSLSHPDLHLDNIFVDSNTMEITCIIDWQSASVSEPFLQQSIPRMIHSADSCSTTSQLEYRPKESSTGVHSDITADLVSHYRRISLLKNKHRYMAMELHNRSLFTQPVSLLSGAWTRDDVFSFRHALIHVAARWKDVAPAMTPCPIRFTESELELHNGELELLEGLGEVLRQLQRDNLIPMGGMVLRDFFEQASHTNSAVKEMFVNMGESESQKLLYSRIWPYQDQDS